MLTKIIVATVGIIIFLFLFWRRLREDYTSGQIFTTSFYMLLGLGAGVTVSANFFPLWWFWFSILGVFLGMISGILRFGMRFFETFESGGIALLPWIGIFFLSDSIEKNSLSSFLAFFLTLCFIVLFYFLDAHYKNFSWYKSGRVGFSGLSSLAVFFLARALVASFFPFVISFVGKYEIILSGVAAFSLFLLVFNLARIKT